MPALVRWVKLDHAVRGVIHGTSVALACVALFANGAGCKGCAQEPVGDSRSSGERGPAPPHRPARLDEVVPSENVDGRKPARRILPAYARDRAYASEEPVEARRVMYRVSLMVPAVLGRAPKAIPRLTAELSIEVTEDRLRARFLGDGWPVEEGSQVRIRRGALGAYVFDAQGGRPLGPGKLAMWFQGGPMRRRPTVRIRAPARDKQVGPGALICRLCAEWSNRPPDKLARRCGDGGTPPLFRVGPWRAERTADVAVKLPRSALRADHGDPPKPIAPRGVRQFLTSRLLARIEPRYRPPAPRSDAGTGLRVDNGGRSKAAVTVAGVPVGWVAPGSTLALAGLERGVYRVGAMRPNGRAAMSARSIRVPTRLRLSR